MLGSEMGSFVKEKVNKGMGEEKGRKVRIQEEWVEGSKKEWVRKGSKREKGMGMKGIKRKRWVWDQRKG
jgi:hypothetical protein